MHKLSIQDSSWHLASIFHVIFLFFSCLIFRWCWNAQICFWNPLHSPIDLTIFAQLFEFVSKWEQSFTILQTILLHFLDKQSVPRRLVQFTESINDERQAERGWNGPLGNTVKTFLFHVHMLEQLGIVCNYLPIGCHVSELLNETLFEIGWILFDFSSAHGYAFNHGRMLYGAIIFKRLLDLLIHAVIVKRVLFHLQNFAFQFFSLFCHRFSFTNLFCHFALFLGLFQLCECVV